MKSPRKFAQQKDNPAIKGSMTVEEIVRVDWERNYKKLDVPLMGARMTVKTHVENGGDIFRVRNTLILVTPEEDEYTEIKFHTITADPFEVYMSLMVMFFIALNKDQGTEEAYTYLPSKAIYRAAKKWLKDFVDIEDAGDEGGDLSKYKIVIDVAGFVANATAQQQKQQQRRG